jgi:hypothetical protein
MDRSLEEMPLNTVPANYSVVDMAKLYYTIGNKEKGHELIEKCAANSLDYLDWAYTLKPAQYQSANILVNTHLYTMQEVMNILNQFDKELMGQYVNDFQKHAQLYQQNMAMRNIGSRGVNR